MVSEVLKVYVGDPTAVGWFTVFVYLVATYRCIVKASLSKKFGGNYHFWLYLGAFLLFLGINKQLDLQTWFEQAMKALAKDLGWYQHKTLLQKFFIIFLGIGMLIILISFRLRLANTWRNYKLTWIGITLLCLFILVRAAAFNRLDFLVNHDFLGFNITEILEVLAILLIISGTFLHKKHSGFIVAHPSSIKDYVEIIDEHMTVQCPRCGTQPLSKAVDGRLFKCRSCGFKFTVTIAN
ncbi:MAG: hypothetical protein CTY27_03915 [Methylotenera sp.]|nr:MAG: hypothetical protein CTY27_03915 [Methylotenera sp.]